MRVRAALRMPHPTGHLRLRRDQRLRQRQAAERQRRRRCAARAAARALATRTARTARAAAHATRTRAARAAPEHAVSALAHSAERVELSTVHPPPLLREQRLSVW